MTIPLTSSNECESYLRNVWERGTIQNQERVYAVYLNHKGERIFHALINKGCYVDTVFDLRETMQYAFNIHSDYIVIAHNHPNGDCSPSERDIEITNNIDTALSMVDITLIDHIILTHESYFSFKDNGLIIRKSLLNFYSFIFLLISTIY